MRTKYHLLGSCDSGAVRCEMVLILILSCHTSEQFKFQVRIIQASSCASEHKNIFNLNICLELLQPITSNYNLLNTIEITISSSSAQTGPEFDHVVLMRGSGCVG